mmetsp:Transcript_68771/g.108404  ORF Transcript_68771/g.108404 Transcript_68771/m.108404 type:complete len:182 (-) Transcript_68771:198-743(-)
MILRRRRCFEDLRHSCVTSCGSLPTPCRGRRVEEYHSPADPFQPKWTLPRTPPEVEERTECSSDMSGFGSERSRSVEVAVQTDFRSDVHQRPKTPMRCLGILLLLATLAGLPQWAIKASDPLAFLPTLEVVQEVAASLQSGCQVNLTEMARVQEALQECQLQGCPPCSWRTHLFEWTSAAV